MILADNHSPSRVEVECHNYTETEREENEPGKATDVAAAAAARRPAGAARGAHQVWGRIQRLGGARIQARSPGGCGHDADCRGDGARTDPERRRRLHNAIRRHPQ